MKNLHKLEFDYANGAGYDFEPYLKFLSEAETRKWIQAWTGNDRLDGKDFFVFGQDGTGGYAAFWNIRNGDFVLDQPIVFFGSEGSAGIVAKNFSEYLWLLAGGVGPSEAIEQQDRVPAPEALSYKFRLFAEKNATTEPLTATEVLRTANQEFPHFNSYIAEICQ